jgi:hypothetical protein
MEISSKWISKQTQRIFFVTAYIMWYNNKINKTMRGDYCVMFFSVWSHGEPIIDCNNCIIIICLHVEFYIETLGGAHFDLSAFSFDSDSMQFSDHNLCDLLLELVRFWTRVLLKIAIWIVFYGPNKHTVATTRVFDP